MGARTVLLQLSLLLLPLLCSSGGSGAYDPCDAQNQYSSIAKSSGGQIIGLAFWINGQLGDWDPTVSVYDNTTNTTTNTSVSLHPCTDRAYLGGVYGASNVIVNTSLFAVSYPAGTNTSVNVSALPSQQDTLLTYYTLSHGLDKINQTYVNKTNSSNTPTSGVGGIFGSGTPVATTVNTSNATYYWKLQPANTTVKYVSVVAFAGSVRSLPRYMRSATASETTNTGVVSQLVLIARYKSGKLYQLDWENMGCSACGGTNSAQCMLVGVTSSNTQAFACGQSNCSTYVTTTVFDKTTNSTTNTTYSPCSFGSYIGFSGTDKYGKPFKSGPQIELLRKYSVSKLASIAGNYAKFAASYAKSQVPTTPSGTNGNSLGRKRS